MTASIIAITFSLWISIKSVVELHRIMKDYSKGIYIEDSIPHTHQHLAVLLGQLIYGLAVPGFIMIGGFVFSVEWVPLAIFNDIIMLYIIEHFSIERERSESVIRLRDLFKIRKYKTVTDKII